MIRRSLAFPIEPPLSSATDYLQRANNRMGRPNHNRPQAAAAASIILAGAAALAGCSSPATVPSPSQLRVPIVNEAHVEKGGVVPFATGRLVVVSEGSMACTYIAPWSSSDPTVEARRIALLWPPHFTFGAKQGSILDARNHMIATTGDYIRLNGAEVSFRYATVGSCSGRTWNGYGIGVTAVSAQVTPTGPVVASWP